MDFFGVFSVHHHLLHAVHTLSYVFTADQLWIYEIYF